MRSAATGCTPGSARAAWARSTWPSLPEAGRWPSRRCAEFDFPDDSDAYIAYDDTLSPGGCEEGIDSEPVTTLKFDDLED
ncbi:MULTISPECIES: hypothetical protein [unclassified Streptomyces]|uniref:hypothetical protein n=1 Tax=unclassified Streptomyces TaxID=2593676 RepID=UPI0036E63615